MKYEYRKNTQMLVDSQRCTVTNVARENGWWLGNLEILKKKKKKE